MPSSLDSFRASIHGDIVVPTDPSYNEAIARWAVNNTRAAKIVVFVKTTEDVVQCIKYAQSQELQIAIRGGGHSISASSSTEGGLVIDLSRYLNGVGIDPDAKLATVGGGALWATVDHAAIQYGLATVAGTVNHTGVGGLLLGGGMGYLAPEHGMVIDNLVQATVVTASGAILTANSSENIDLFWAIRGGGSNFGVCVEFILKLHPQRRKIFAGFANFTEPTVKAVIDAVDQWWKNGPSVKEVIFQIFTRHEGKEMMELLLVYNGPEKEGREKFRTIFDLGPTVDTTTEIPYENLNAITNHLATPGRNVYMKSVQTIDPQPTMIYEAFKNYAQVTEPQWSEIQSNVIHEYYPTSRLASVPNDAMAFCRRGNKVTMLAFSAWDQDSPQRMELARRLTNSILKVAVHAEKKIVEEDNIGYGNYDSDVNQQKSQALFANNLPKLRQLKLKYDPNVIFSKGFPLMPASAA